MLIYIVIALVILFIILWFTVPAFAQAVNGWKTILWSVLNALVLSLEQTGIAKVIPEGVDPAWFYLGSVIVFTLLRVETALRTGKQLGE